MFDIILFVVDKIVNFSFAMINNDIVAILNSYVSLVIIACIYLSIYVIRAIKKYRKELNIGARILASGSFFVLSDLFGALGSKIVVKEK